MKKLILAEFDPSSKLAWYRLIFQEYLFRFTNELISLKEQNNQITKYKLFQRILKMEVIILNNSNYIQNCENLIISILSKKQLDKFDQIIKKIKNKLYKYQKFKLSMFQQNQIELTVIEQRQLDLMNYRIYSAYYKEQIIQIESLYQSRSFQESLQKCIKVQKNIKEDLKNCTELKNVYFATQIIQFKSFYKTQQISKSINLYEKCGKEWFKQSDYQNNYILANKSNQAAKFFQKAIELDKTIHKPFVRLGLILTNKQQFQEAIDCYDQGLTYNDSEIKLLQGKGYCQLILKLYANALLTWQKSIDINPNDDVAYANKGHALYHLKRFEEAIEMYDRALQINPDDEITYNNKGNALNELGRFEEAILMYDQAIEIDHTLFSSFLNKGIALHELNRFKEAISQYDSAIFIKQDCAEAYFNKGKALKELNKLDEAVLMFKKSFKLNPELQQYLNSSRIPDFKNI